VLLGEVHRRAARLTIDEDVDLALALQTHCLGAMPSNPHESKQIEDTLQHSRNPRSEFNEFKTTKPHRIRTLISPRAASQTVSNIGHPSFDPGGVKLDTHIFQLTRINCWVSNNSQWFELPAC
jgi:hypothetical protein